MTSTQPLAGRVALVTGAGRNIGRAIALALAQDGAAVVVNARSNKAEADAVASEIVGQGGKAISLIADIADASAVERMVAAAASDCAMRGGSRPPWRAQSANLSAMSSRVSGSWAPPRICG